MPFRMIDMRQIANDDRARAANEAVSGHMGSCRQCSQAVAVMMELPPETPFEGLRAVAGTFCAVGAELLDALGRLGSELGVHAIEVDD